MLLVNAPITHNKSNLYYRMSTKDDFSQIKELMMLRFGDRERFNVLDNIDGRYLLCVTKDNEVVAMTGIINEGNYIYPEIDWTCIKPEYEGNGIITSMMKLLLDKTDTNIFCSCWRWSGNEYVNLQRTMDTLGFKKVMPEHKKFDARYYDFCAECTYRKDNCMCYEDLFLYER